MTDTGPLKAELIAAIAATETLEQLEAVRLNALGKKGLISSQLKALGGLVPDDRQKKLGRNRLNNLSNDPCEYPLQ